MKYIFRTAAEKDTVVRAQRIDNAITLLLRYFDRVRPWRRYKRLNKPDAILVSFADDTLRYYAIETDE